MRILVSPVGTADPITTLGDGPMLHVVRHYAPDEVVLLLTQKMVEYEDSDHRYTRAIEDLSRLLNRNAPKIEVVNLTVDQVYRYDLFLPEFESCLARLRERSPKAEIIVNISSGTPAMGQALSALHAFDRYHFAAIQVTTPRKGINKRDDREDPEQYEYDYLWELNVTEIDNTQNRCVAVESQHFSELIQKDNIRALVESYDFVGAAELADGCPGLSKTANKLLKGSVFRMRMSLASASDFFRGTSFPVDPSEALFEYLSILEVHIWRSQWADFLRATTPAFFETMHARVRTYISDECWLTKDYSGAWVLNPNKICQNKELHSCLEKWLGDQRQFANPRLTHDMLIKMLELHNDPDIKTFKNIRKWEQDNRNVAAHQISEIKHKPEFGKKLAELFALAGYEDRRGLYKRIAYEICNQL